MIELAVVQGGCSESTFCPATSSRSDISPSSHSLSLSLSYVSPTLSLSLSLSLLPRTPHTPYPFTHLPPPPRPSTHASLRMLLDGVLDSSAVNVAEIEKAFGITVAKKRAGDDSDDDEESDFDPDA